MVRREGPAGPLGSGPEPSPSRRPPAQPKVCGLSDLSSLIKAYDVRGVVPDQWDEEISAAIGSAFAEFVVSDSGATAVVTAHDMRESSIPLSRAFAEGVI